MTRTAHLAGEMRTWRHGFHRRPELAFDVHATAARVAELLTGFGCEVHTGIGRTGVVGVLRRGTSARSIGLRADMDALPITEAGEHAHRSQVDGAFHGCGHDGHTAMLLGAARHLAETGRFDGTVHLLFQPDEENGRGAQAMIDDGVLERFPISAVYGLHTWPGIGAGSFATRPGPMMSSEDLFTITVRGRGGHASTPERHIDPVVVAAEVVLALQTIVARSVAATHTAVVSVTEVHSDGARNIIPSTVVVKGDCRTFDAGVQAVVESTMRRLVAGICAAHGAEGSVEYTHEYIPLVNTEAEWRFATDTAVGLVGPDRVVPDAALITASEDFARFLQVVPGCFMTIGNGLDGACGASLHNPRFDFNDDILTTGADYWVALAERALPLPS